MTIDFSTFNWLAIAAAAFATFMLGGLWYTALFGKLWARLNNYTDDKLKATHALRPPPVFFGTLLVCYTLMSLFMAILVRGTGSENWCTGAVLGLVVWSIAQTVNVSYQIASDKPIKAWLVDAGYQAIYFPMTAMILAAWR
ncbi:MAG: DUF1761 domain-containing protein [Phycisphaerales bacterium]